MDGVGSAGENDHARVQLRDCGERGGAGDAEREDGEGSDSACDEVCVLGTEVQDQNQVRFHGLRVHRHSFVWRCGGYGVLGFKP